MAYEAVSGWGDSRLTAVLDWDCAGVGPAGIDLGSLRCDAAWSHGLEAAEYVLLGWEAEAGRTASDVDYWIPSRPWLPLRTWAGFPWKWPITTAPT